MILLIDIGNSRIKWATWVANEFAFGSAAPYKSKPFFELAHSLWYSLAAPQRILVANVAGDAMQKQLSEYTQQRWRVTAEFLPISKQAFGVTNGYSEYNTLGIDRWLALLAAWNHVHAALAVFDCGSALTLDVIDNSGQHLGGLIVPGLELLQQALVKGTEVGTKLQAAATSSHLPQSQDLKLGSNTQTGIALGNHYLMSFYINQLVTALKTKYGKQLHLFITGGDAATLLPYLPKEFMHKPHLVLEGLALYVKH